MLRLQRFRRDACTLHYLTPSLLLHTPVDVHAQVERVELLSAFMTRARSPEEEEEEEEEEVFRVQQSAASMDMMAEEQRVKRTLTEEAKKRKGRE
ncbi:hypothetical protein GBF38_000140 [Nibea albiflora]|nr:hypothetical protein GBF38_000140 [Nibea albiflora]